MDERQKLQSDLKRYRTLRDLIHDEPAMATIEEMIREAEDRLRQIESGPIKRSWPPSLSGARQRAFRPRGPAPRQAGCRSGAYRTSSNRSTFVAM